MEVYGTERSNRVKQRWNREFWAVLFCGRTFPQRDAVCPCLENISYGSHLSSSHDYPYFQCFTCKNVLIRYKNLNSRYFSFLLPYSFALKNTFSFFFFYSRLFCGSRTPSVATCVGHPLCPSIWPQWYEEAHCS